MIEQVRPLPHDPPIPRTPTCCAHVNVSEYERKWRLGKGETEPFTCSRRSVVVLDGKHYCRLHGGFAALDLYLQGKLKEPSQ